jgi:hypothetical protein
MENLVWLVLATIVLIIVSAGINGTLKKSNSRTQYSYSRKSFLTESEKRFLELLLPLKQHGIIVVPQINLASIIKKNGNARFNTELFRNIDFGLFDKDFKIKLLIELNDKTHNQKSRKYRDIRVREIVKIAQIPIITFYTNKPNRQEYVLSRIIETIKNDEEKNA